MQTYLDLSNQGKNEWWRYLLSVIFILFTWQIIGSIPYGIFILWGYLRFPTENGILQFLQNHFSLMNFTLLMLGAACLTIAVFIAVKYIHQRNFKTLITPHQKISRQRILQGFLVWMALSFLVSLVEAWTHPGRYVWTFKPALFIPFILLALIFVPIQTSGEEFFFRAYIIQGIGRKVKNIWGLSILSGIFFMVPHFLNPEASLNFAIMGMYYFSMGAFLGFITLYDGRLELALGVHAANNLFSFLFANSTVTVVPSPSLFTVNGLDVFYSLVAEIIGIAIFICLFLLDKKIKSWKNRSSLIFRGE